ncbi:translocase of chloroplast 90, chloroplastic [Heracleum sosnowskyi]|uniref:Translocase of chloroplast 90, chloroplastic n=1 Tax=Heracleum sosnowskyi TaxID=360622 RepID=A0AAD8JCT1_9APIA|nr:translocase of chloroplast 90, chloroplastic [Heracleum sosnowskyi]
MMSVKDWIFSQLLSKSFASARPLSGGTYFEEESFHDEFGNRGSAHTTNLMHASAVADTSVSPGGNPESQNHSSSQINVVENSSNQPHRVNLDRKLNPLSKIENLQIKFLRLLRRFGQMQDNLMVAKVLYRMHLATLISAGESDIKRANIRRDTARAIAAEQEITGVPELDFSFRVLVLGKTGVGKSSTINSIFDETKVMTDAFYPATDNVQEIVGTFNGIKVSFIDTPGLLPSSAGTVGKNRKILYKVKKFLRKHPPDMVLYFERLDLINNGYSDFPLLKLITKVFGSAIWFNTILVMTHSSSALPEGANGSPVTYESYVAQCTNLVQHYIHQAVADPKLENPVLLVENHAQCRTDINGEKILPNGQVWRFQFFLLCMCTKILADVNTLLKFQDSIELGPPSNQRLPSLPHLLSAFLRNHIMSTTGDSNDIDELTLSDLEEEEYDEYEQLPPIRILTKSQFEKLSNNQKKDYLDELDYRETLFLKKQLIEDIRRREKKHSKGETSALDGSENLEETPEPVALPDMAVPLSFDPDYPVHRYRCVITSDQWLARPVLDPHGWDHDVGFDGINLDTTVEVRKNVHASVSGQMSKDKQDFSIQSQCAAAFAHPRGPTYGVGVDVQSSGEEMIYTVHGNTKLRTLKHNCTECGLSATSFGNKYFFGAKLEDSISVSKRLKFVINGGRMGGLGQVAYGGSFETTFRGKDYPVRNDKLSQSSGL